MKQHRTAIALAAALAVLGVGAAPAAAQDPPPAQDKPGQAPPAPGQAPSASDPFFRVQPKKEEKKVIVPDKPIMVPFPTIEQRTQEYLRAKSEAQLRNKPVPNEVGKYLVSELSVTGIFETEAGLGAFVEVTSTKQTFFVPVGTRVYNGELIEIKPMTNPPQVVFREQIDYIVKKVKTPDVHTVVKPVTPSTAGPGGD